MSKVWIIGKKELTIAVISAALIVATLFFLLNGGHDGNAIPVHSPPKIKERVIHMVTGEFKGTTADGEEIEAYVWHPGTIYVTQGEHIQLRIYGVNGKSHPFVIEGLNIKGEVQQGKETVVQFTADKKGTYKLICFAHADTEHNGPMIAYIVVD